MRITKKLREEILFSIKQLFETRAKKNCLTDSFWLKVLDEAKKEIIKHSINTPESWNTEVTRARFCPGSFDTRIDSFKTIIYISPYCLKYMDLPVPLTILNINTLVSHTSVDITMEMWTDAHVKEYMEYRQTEHELAMEHEAFSDKVTKIMGNCNTVKQLIKYWPEVNALLPEYVKTRLEKPRAAAAARKEQQPPLNEEAIATLNVSLMKNMILGK